MNQFVPYMYFKIRSFQTLKYMLKETDYMCKIDVKDASFSVPLEKSCRHLGRFIWEGNFNEFLCLVLFSDQHLEFLPNFERPNIPFALSKY